MSAIETGLFNPGLRANWIRLRTLIVLRWIAIVGQICAITVADQVYGLRLPLTLCYAAVGAAVVANLIAIFAFPESKRLSEREVVSMILFDICQLSFLIYLTGGLHNPFALLILAPVTISATVLGLRSTVFLGIVALTLTSLVANFHIPLRNSDGAVLNIPQIFVFGFWAAIVIGVIFISVYARRVSNEMHSMSDALLATQMALAREQKLTDLGGVVAAAAHELGTPLATIKLASAELMDELSELPELHQDATLIRDQADRCRQILRSMGRSGKEDQQLRRAPLGEAIGEAAEPHENRGIDILYDISPFADSNPRQPIIRRQAELIHGLRNLIQNAVDFAMSTVWVHANWTETEITVQIIDDGPGYPPHVLGRIGDPFMRRRPGRISDTSRPEYEGMGLGLFIAKTLLERTSAGLHFECLGRSGRSRKALQKARRDCRGNLAARQNRRPRCFGRRALGENQKILV